MTLDDDAARIALIDLAESFDVSPDALDDLLPVAKAGRLYLEKGKAVYRLKTPIELAGGQGAVDVFALRAPSAKDYIKYTKGTTVTVKDGATMLDGAAMAERTLKAVSELADQPIGIVDRMSRADVGTLQEVCDALGFFE